MIPRYALVVLVWLVCASLGHAAAADNWSLHCAKCHGADGAGKTPVGRKLGLKDFTDPAVQATLDDEKIRRTIAEGVSLNGKERMKAFGKELSAEEISQLARFVRGLAKAQ